MSLVRAGCFVNAGVTWCMSCLIHHLAKGEFDGLERLLHAGPRPVLFAQRIWGRAGRAVD